MTRRGWVDIHSEVTQKRQCVLAHRHHLHPPETWLCVLGGGHRLVHTVGFELAHQQQHGGGGAMIVDKYGAKEACPVAHRCTGSAFGEQGIEKSDEPELESKNRGRAI